MNGKKSLLPPEQDLPVPARSLDSERTLLANCLVFGSEAYAEVADFLEPDDFYEPAHGEIWAAFRSVSTIVLDAVQEALKSAKHIRRLGGPVVYPATLAAAGDWHDVPSRTRYHAERVKEAAREREIILLGREMEREAVSGANRAEIAEKYAVRLHGIAQNPARGPETGVESSIVAETALDAYQDAKALHAAGRRFLGLSTGFYELDELINGLCPAEMTVLAARPSLGKTTMALQIMMEVCRQGAHVVLFSLEMSFRQIAARLACLLGRVNAERARKGMLTEGEEERYVRAAGEIAEMPLTIYETPGATVGTIRRHLERERQRHEVKLWIIDHLHLMNGPGDSGNERMGNISRDLRAMSIQDDAPHLLVLAQLSRKPEERLDKRPQMADLRDSGGIEQDALNVLLLHRPGFYAEVRKNWSGKMDELIRYAALLVPKTRFGPTGEVDLVWIPERACFENPTPTY